MFVSFFEFVNKLVKAKQMLIEFFKEFFFKFLILLIIVDKLLTSSSLDLTKSKIFFIFINQ